MMLRERLYLMLSKINHYRTIKRVNAYLFLVLIIIPEDEQTVGNFEKLQREFEPAITNGLLIIREVEISVEENDKILKSK